MFELFMTKILYVVGTLLVAWITLKLFRLGKRFFWVSVQWCAWH